jgi:hypothetical protein
LLAEILAAHGGTERWESLHGLEAQLSAWGLLFRAKRRPPLNHQRVRVSTREPRVWFDDYPKPGLMGELRGLEAVRIRNAAGAIVVQRSEPRAFFRSLRRQLSWDDLDLLYFAGYAIWNPLTAPFLFLRPGCALEALEPVRTTIGMWRRLRVQFPPDVPTHCPQQVFYFDGQGRLVRLDYTAEVVGRWARAAHTCDDHRWFEGLLIPTRRRVTPRALGRALSGPTLVGITVHDVRGIPAAALQG